MALSDSEREKDRKRTKTKSLKKTSNERWSDQQKLEAVKSWLVLGNMCMVSRLHSIPRITLQVWKTTNWWKELVEELKLQERIELSSKMKQMIDAAHTVVADRLANGDHILDQKTGQIVRKPVNMKDAHKVAVDLLNQRDLVEKATKPVGDQEQNTDKLELLAERFASFAAMKLEQKLDNKRTVPMADVVDVEEKLDAVHEERETRLQDGVPEIPFSTGANQEQDGADDSPQAS